MRSSLSLCKSYRPPAAHIQLLFQQHDTRPKIQRLIGVWRPLAFFCHPLTGSMRTKSTESIISTVNSPPDATHFTFHAGTVVDPYPGLAVPIVAHSPGFHVDEHRPRPT